MTEIKVFDYGAQPPAPDNPVREQMKLSRNYYNQIVEAENKRRQIAWGEEKFTTPHPPEVIILPDGTKKTNWCKCDRCQAHWNAVRKAYKQLEPLDIKPLRAAAIKTGLYWGSYLLVEQDFSRAWKTTKFYQPVKFRSWKKGGSAGVQIHDNRCSSFFQIEKIPDPEPSKRTKKRDKNAGKGKRRGQLRTIRIRIGSDSNKPVWSDPVSFKMHRPLEGNVVWVKIHMYYRGDREIWSVGFTCNNTLPRIDSATDGVVAIDVSWRILPDGDIRLAYAKGDDGIIDELTLDPYWRERIARADRIRSERDRQLNALKEKDPRFNILKSPRSVRFFAHNKEIDTPQLDNWIKRERHLEQYELGCRRKTYAVRRNAVRVWLRELRRKYTTVVIKDSSHKEMKDHKKAKEAGLHQAARKQGHHVAPGEIVEEICRVFGRQENVAVVTAYGATATCVQCGHMQEVGAERLVTCERCDNTDDRDHISTQNLLTRYFKGEYEKPTSRKTTARFAKRHKKSKQEEECPRDGL